MPVLAFAELDRKAAPMPGSSGPVELARLPALDEPEFRAFVRFPARWSRPATGHYAVSEEFLVLTGDLKLNGQTWQTGGFARIPAGHMRSGSCSAAGCLAFVWFGGVPCWEFGAPTTNVIDTASSFAHWRDAPARENGGEGCARELYSGPDHTTWLVEYATLRELAMLGTTCETLRLRDHAWMWDQPFDAKTGFTEPFLVRTR